MNFKAEPMWNCFARTRFAVGCGKALCASKLLTLGAVGCDDGLIVVGRSLMMAAWSYGVNIQPTGNR